MKSGPPRKAGPTKARMFVSQKRIVVEFGDCDPAGIVYNPQYLRWFDACTSALFANAGIPFKTVFKAHGGIGIPIVNVQAKFLLPSTYGDELMAESTVTRWGKSSFEVRHRFSKHGVLAVEGLETHVWSERVPGNPERIRSRPIPPEVIERLSVARTVSASP
jgi:4-hydroxybenzoyl-CoA thioesterase